VYIHPAFHSHPTEEMLEEYAFERLPETETAVLEEHLLVCEACQRELAGVDEFILRMKAGTAAFRTPSRVQTAWVHLRRTMEPPPVRAAMVIGACALALLVPIGLTKWRRTAPAPKPVTIALAAFRGGEQGALAEGPAGRRLTLSIDAADLAAAESYRAEVVNASGRRAWRGPATLSGASLSFVIDRGFKPGTYWVRLYTVQGRLLREFGLRLQ
jgi:putative zinc finger protein